MSKFSIVLKSTNGDREVLYKGTKAEMTQNLENMKNANRYGNLESFPEGSLVVLEAEAKGQVVSFSQFTVERRRTRQARIFSLVVKTLVGFEAGEKAIQEEFAGAIMQFGTRHAVSQYMARSLQAEALSRMVQAYINLPRYKSFVEQEESGAPVLNVADLMQELAQEMETVIEMATSALLQASDAAAHDTDAVCALSDQMTLSAKASVRREVKSLHSMLTHMM